MPTYNLTKNRWDQLELNINTSDIWYEQPLVIPIEEIVNDIIRKFILENRKMFNMPIEVKPD